ncbi:MAG TPA: hypothetical protein VK968_14870, partial [Roseimicrobium sp.]|nr:hypothetical protein [Roseimicrobium sp.]
QSDITENGYVFSAVIIFLGNAMVLLIGVPLLTGQVGLVAVFRGVAQETLHVLWWLGGFIRR